MVSGDGDAVKRNDNSVIITLFERFYPSPLVVIAILVLSCLVSIRKVGN